MNKIVPILTVLLSINYIALAQDECGLDHYLASQPAAKYYFDIPDAYLYVPESTDPIKTLRVNIHFILRESSHVDYPGNYTKSDDGNGNTNYTGYDFAEELIDEANGGLDNNRKMNLPPGNSTAVIDGKYRYVLNGVFFHEENSMYVYTENPETPNNYFNLNTYECINLFMQGENTNFGSTGVANISGNPGDRAVAFNGLWDKGYEPLAFARILNHEIGHNLSLHHTIISPRSDGTGANCNQNDYCSDTPTNNELISGYGIDPCNDCERYNPVGDSCPNNLMGYSGKSAVTPLQFGRAHWTIENEIYETKTCYFSTASTNIISFTDNTLVVAETVIIPSANNIVVEDYEALYISAESFVINGTLEIEAGSQLTVFTEPNCY